MDNMNDNYIQNERNFNYRIIFSHDTITTKKDQENSGMIDDFLELVRHVQTANFI